MTSVWPRCPGCPTGAFPLSRRVALATPANPSYERLTSGSKMRLHLDLDPVHGKDHERRSTECIGKDTAQEVPDRTYNAKSYPVFRALAQSVCLSEVCKKLADRDQPQDHPQR